MRINREEHCRFVRWLDRTAEKNPVLWLPCIILLAIILGFSGLIADIKMVAVRTDREAAPILHREVFIRKKPFALRAVAVALVMAFSFTIMPECKNVLSIDVFATEETSSSEFNVYAYMADNILSETTSASDFYYIYFKSPRPRETVAEMWYRCFSSDQDFMNSVAKWESVNLILEPGDLYSKSIEAKGYYTTVLLSMLKCNYESDTVINRMSSIGDIKKISKDYQSFVKFYKELYSSYEEDDLNAILELWKDVYTPEQVDMLRKAQKEWFKENFDESTLGGLSNAFRNYMTLYDSAQTVNDLIEQFVSYCMVSQISEEWKECIIHMYNNCSGCSMPLKAALEDMYNIVMSDNWNLAALSVVAQNAINTTGADIFSTCVDFLIDEFIGSCPFIKGMEIGKAVGKSISNMLFSTDKTIEEFYIISAYCDVMNIFRNCLNDVEAQYKNNKSPEKAKKFLAYVNMYFEMFEIGNEFGQDFTDVIYTGGIANSLFRSQEGYDLFTNNRKKSDEDAKLAHNNIQIGWLNNELFYDYPDLYAIYAEILGDKLKIISVTEVAFEKEAVEWGLKDAVHYGYDCSVIPSNADNKEIIYSSSNKNIATIDEQGRLILSGLGTCIITATSMENPDAFDTLSVTVVDENGADSLPITEITPIVPLPDSPSDPDDPNKYGNVVYSGTYGKFFWKINDEGTLFVGGKGELSPIGNGGFTQSAIENIPWYRHREDVKKVIVEDGITALGQFAVAGMIWAKEVTLPSTLKSIGFRALGSYTSLTKIYMPPSIKTIHDEALFSHSPHMVVYGVPDSYVEDFCYEKNYKFKSIYAFDSSVVKIKLGEKSIVQLNGDYTNDYSKYSFTCDSDIIRIIGYEYEDNKVSILIEGIGEGTDELIYLFDGKDVGKINVTVSETAASNNRFAKNGLLYEIDGGNVFVVSLESPSEYVKTNNSITIPNKVSVCGIEFSVNKINRYAFNEVALKEIIIPEGIQSIGHNAFSNTEITEITIPESVTELESGVFSECKNLRKVKLPDGIRTIPREMFSKCSSLSDIILPVGLEMIGEDAFQDCTSLTEIVVPYTVKDLKSGSFYGCTNAIVYYPYNGNECSAKMSVGYIIDGESVKIVRIRSTEKAITIPANVPISYGVVYPVSGLASHVLYTYDDIQEVIVSNGILFADDSAFCSNSLRKIVLPDGMTLGKSVFNGNKNLTDVTLPKTINAINEKTFYGCESLKEITIPEDVEIIDDSAFIHCNSLEKVDLPIGLKKIGAWAFSDCTSLKELIIPVYVEEIDGFAFNGSVNANIYYPISAMPKSGYDTFYGALINTNDNFGYSFSNGEIKAENIQLEKERTEFTIPSDIYGFPVTEIAEHAFKSCPDLQKIYIPQYVKNISIGAFYPNINNRVLPLTEFDVSAGNQHYKVVDGVLFTKDGSELVAYPSEKELQSYVVPDSTKIIHSYAFTGNKKLKSIVFPDKLEKIESFAFSQYFTSINDGVNIEGNIYIPETVTEIGERAFYDVKNAVFYYPSSAVVGKLAFYNALKYTINGTEISVGLNSYFEETLVIPSAIGGYIITEVANSKDSSNLTSVSLPNSVNKIGNNAFASFDSLNVINIPDAVTEIGENAFRYCKSLTSITLPNSLTTIGESAFYNCENLKEIILPERLTSIGDEAFSYCTSLESISIPSGVNRIGREAFHSCEKLNSVYIEDGVTSIDDYAFRYCYALVKAIIPKSVTDIGWEAFRNCNQLTIYGYRSSQAEKYAKNQSITFVFLDDIDVPIDTVLELINKAAENTVLRIDTTKYGTTLTSNEISAAKSKNLTFEIVGNGFSWKIKAAYLPDNTNVDFSIIIPSGENLPDKFGVPIEKHVDFAVMNPSGAVLTYNCDIENAGKNANIFTASNGVFTYVDSIIIDANGVISFVPSNDCCYFIAIDNSIITSLTSDIKTYHIIIPENVTVTRNNEKLTNESILNTGDVLTITANDIPGYQLKSLKVNGIDIENGTTFTVGNENVVISVEYSIVDNEHTHSFSNNWKSDSTYHWHECLCGEKSDISVHTEGSGAVTVQPTSESSGEKKYSCTVCDYVMRTELIPSLEETHTHHFSSNWSADKISHWHECFCGEKSDISVHTEDNGIVTVQPTSTATGLKVYSCIVCGYVIRTETIPALEETHTHYFSSLWSADRYSHWRECQCGEKSDISAHTEDSGVVTVRPTAVSAGVITYSCRVCGYVMRTVGIPPTDSYFYPYPTPILPIPTYPETPVVTTAPTEDEKLVDQLVANDIEISLKCKLNGLSKGTARLITKKKFFDNSAIVSVSQTDASNDAASKAVANLNGGSEYNITYPFDITIYNTDTNEIMPLRDGGYINLEIPIPKSLEDYADEVSVYHIANGIPELLESSMVISDETTKIHFTASDFSPFMFNVHTEIPVEDLAPGAGTMANEVPVDAGIPVTNGVTIPNAILPKNLKFSNKKRKYRILRKRKLSDLVFVY